MSVLFLLISSVDAAITVKTIEAANAFFLAKTIFVITLSSYKYTSVDKKIPALSTRPSVMLLTPAFSEIIFARKLCYHVFDVPFIENIKNNIKPITT
jgi:hypothetical protein